MRWSYHAVLRKERRMSIMDRFRERNEKFAKDFDRGDAPMPPAERFVVLTCMDARLHPESFLGMEIGDAHVIRNAGGRASDAALMDFLPFSDLEESVRDDVRRIRNNPFIPPDVEVSGWVYDVKTGKLQEIVPVGR